MTFVSSFPSFPVVQGHPQVRRVVSSEFHKSSKPQSISLITITMWPLLLIVPVIFFAQRISAQSGTCYFANGTALPNDPGYNEYQPCTSGPSTICCGINRANPAGGDSSKGFTVDECLPNGLCQNRITTDGVEKTSYVKAVSMLLGIIDADFKR